MKADDRRLKTYQRPQLVRRDKLARVSGEDSLLISLVVKPT
jgi:hypothetical protein